MPLRQFTKLPPAEAVEGSPKLKELFGELESTSKANRRLRGELEGLEGDLSRARGADRKARVAAQRSGKADPGRANEERVNGKIDAVRDRGAVLEAAVEQIEAEIAAEASQARGAQLAASHKQIDLHNARLSKLLSEVGAELEARAGARGMIEWITDLPHGFKPVRYEQGGLSEQTALNVLVASVEDTGSEATEEEGAR